MSHLWYPTDWTAIQIWTMHGSMTFTFRAQQLAGHFSVWTALIPPDYNWAASPSRQSSLKVRTLSHFTETDRDAEGNGFQSKWERAEDLRSVHHVPRTSRQRARHSSFSFSGKLPPSISSIFNFSIRFQLPQPFISHFFKIRFRERLVPQHFGT